MKIEEKVSRATKKAFVRRFAENLERLLERNKMSRSDLGRAVSPADKSPAASV
jgi:hypothetical protein